MIRSRQRAAPRPGSGRNTGFTLVEMLLALVIFSLLSGAGVMVVRSGIQSKDQVEERSEALARLQVARAILRADITQIAQRPVRVARDGSRPPLATGPGFGDQPILTLVRRGWINPGRVEPRSSLQTVEYFLKEGDLIRRAYMRSDPTPDTPYSERVLLSGITELEMAFRDLRAWVPDWPLRAGSGNSLPFAVAMTLETDAYGSLRQVFLTPEVVP